MGSSLFPKDLHSAHEPETGRTAAFRLLPRTLRSRALKRPKSHGPGSGFRGSLGRCLFIADLLTNQGNLVGTDSTRFHSILTFMSD